VLHAIVLAAGKGTRMKSTLPKVVHKLRGVPMVVRAVDAAIGAGATRVAVVVGYGAPRVHAVLCRRWPGMLKVPKERLVFAPQRSQRGTGDAARCWLKALAPRASDRVLILYGDSPLLRSSTLRELIAGAQQAPLALLAAKLTNPSGYGRVLRGKNGTARRVVEERDASARELRIREVNAGVYVARASFLSKALARLRVSNAQCELYLTDIVASARGRAQIVVARAREVQGVNTKADLSRVERLVARGRARR
jgi:bifunctional UDP-N-acetylglucosamine pyrophosphorylase/glucosamine-1-phosphate N-acetyltransferase